MGISEAASVVTERSTATTLTFYFSILVLACYIVDTIFISKWADSDEYSYYAGMYYGYEDATKDVPIVLVIASIACSVIY